MYSEKWRQKVLSTILAPVSRMSRRKRSTRSSSSRMCVACMVRLSTPSMSRKTSGCAAAVAIEGRRGGFRPPPGVLTLLLLPAAALFPTSLPDGVNKCTRDTRTWPLWKGHIYVMGTRRSGSLRRRAAHPWLHDRSLAACEAHRAAMGDICRHDLACRRGTRAPAILPPPWSLRVAAA